MFKIGKRWPNNHIPQVSADSHPMREKKHHVENIINNNNEGGRKRKKKRKKCRKFWLEKHSMHPVIHLTPFGLLLISHLPILLTCPYACSHLTRKHITIGQWRLNFQENGNMCVFTHHLSNPVDRRNSRY